MTRALGTNGVFLALSGIVVWVLATIGAANERAVADSFLHGQRTARIRAIEPRF